MTSTMKRGSRRARAIGAPLALVIAALAPGSVEAIQVRPLNLEQLTERADRIFSGRCIEVLEAQDVTTGLRVATTTIRVDRGVKGPAAETVTFRSLLRAPAVGLPAGSAPGFAVGEEVVLFLYGDSALGLTSPVGAGQGKFSVSADKHGRKVAINAFGNRELARGLSTEAASLAGAAIESSGALGELSPEGILDWAAGLVRRNERRPAGVAGTRAR